MIAASLSDIQVYGLTATFLAIIVIINVFLDRFHTN